MIQVRSRPLLSLLLIGGLLRLCIAWAPIEWLLRYVLSDDAFYYFTIARNAVHGFGFTFDRIAETNGFHPLWLFILLPFQAVIQDKILAIHTILSLSAIIDTLTVYFLWVLLREQDVRQNVRLILCSLYAISPILFSHVGPLSGLETALNLMIISAYLILYLRILRSDVPQLKQALTFGIVSALVFLTRTDNIVLLIVSYVHIGIRFRCQAGRLKSQFASAATAFVLLAPWLVWSYVSFGSFVQVSGQSIAFATKANLATQGWGLTDYLVQLTRNLGNVVTFFPLYLYNTSSLSLIPLLITIAIGVFALSTIWLLRSRNNNPEDVLSQSCKWLLPLLVVVVGYVAVHTFRAVYLRAWYYSSLLPILFLVGGLTIEMFVRLLQPTFRLALRRISLVALLLALTIYGESLHRVFTKSAGETDKYQMVSFLNRILPEKTTVGSWNAGIIGYFFERGSVVNLDGLVNNVAFEYIKSRSLGDYCRQVGVTYLVDPVGSFRYWEPYWDQEPSDMLHMGDVIYEAQGENPNRNLVVLHLRR